jgi:hypothetical protein
MAMSAPPVRGAGVGAAPGPIAHDMRDAPPRTVLIGFADALAAPETAWSLRDGGCRVIAFARRGSRPALRHAHGVTLIEVTAPEVDAEATVSELAAGLAAHRADALMPLDDAAVWLADAVSRRTPDVLVAGPTGPRAALALDKREQLAAARTAGFAVPPTEPVTTAADLAALSLPLPIALKPALAARRQGDRLCRGSGWMCGTSGELQAAAQAWGEAEPLLAQPLIAGVGEGLFGLAGPDGVRALSAHRRVRMMNPQGSGSSACEAIAVDPALAAAAGRMLSAVGWQGLFMLEFLRDADGTAWFMELNGRTWGSMALARRQGLEYPAWALAGHLPPDDRRGGFDPPPGGAGLLAAGREGLVCRHLGRELVHLMMVARGPRSRALTGWPTRRDALAAVLRVHRGERWYNWRAGELRVFLADTVQTVLAPLRRRR